MEFDKFHLNSIRQIDQSAINLTKSSVDIDEPSQHGFGSDELSLQFLDEKQLEIFPQIISTKSMFEEKMNRIKGFLSSFESQFISKNDQLFTQVIIHEVSLMKNFEYDVNTAIKVISKGYKIQSTTLSF